SLRRFAARPVGAHSKQLSFFARRINRIESTSVVFPTPGPPVITKTRDSSAFLRASRCVDASSLPVFRWHQAIAFSTSIGGKHDGALANFLSKQAMPSSARLKYGK